MFNNNNKLDFISKYPSLHPTNLIKLESIRLNANNNQLIQNNKLIYPLLVQLITISGQKPQIKYAKKNVSAFNIREGHPTGLLITLRKIKLNTFFNKLMFTVIPKYSQALINNYNSKAFYLTYNIGWDKLKYWGELQYVKNYFQNNDGLSLEICLKEQGVKKNTHLNLFALSLLQCKK